MFFRSAMLAAALFAGALPVAAHVSVLPAEVMPGQVWHATVRIGHGCEGSPTVRVEATIPAMIGAPKPVAKPGWKIETLGTTIIWSGGSLPANEQGEFPFETRVAKDANLGPVVVPIVQKCEKGEHRWIDVVQPGEAPKHLQSPAPVLTVVKQVNVSLREPWLRATPKGARVAGGFGIFINPGAADRLLSASFPSVAGRTEIHEMAMANGMMTMRPLPQGVEIPGNGRLEFKPGSFHLMLMELKEPLMEGQSIEGTLVFEKAGPVRVTFPVVAIGAPGPASHHKH